MYSFLLANWGFLAKGIREVASNQSVNTVDDIVSTRLALWLIGTIIGTGIGFLIWKNSEISYLIILAQLSNLGTVFIVDFYFLGRKNTFIPGLLRFISQLLFLMLIYIFFMNDNSLLTLFIILIFIRLFEGLLFFGIFKLRSNTRTVPNIKFKKSLLILWSNFHLGLGSKMGLITLSLPLILIPFYFSEAILGIYSVAHKLFLLVITVFSVFSVVLAPQIIEYLKFDKNQQIKMYRKTLWAAGLVALLIGVAFYLIGVRVIELLFEPIFQQAINYIPFFALLIPVWAIYIVTTSFINNLGLDNNYSKISVFHFIISVVLIVITLKILDPRYTILALGLSTLIATIQLHKRVINFINIKHG